MNKTFKLTALERSWILYDIGNSAFILMVSTLIPIYFNALAASAGVDENLYLSYWGYAGSIATVLVAIIGPICGALSDRNFKKPLFLLCVAVGVISCALLGFSSGWLLFLGIFVAARVGYSSSIVFYDSMLPEITEEGRMDTISSMGYAYGYIGSVIPFILCLVLVLGGGSFGLSQTTAMMLAFLVTALWWLGCTLPLAKRYRQKAYVTYSESPWGDSFRQLGRTIRDAQLAAYYAETTGGRNVPVDVTTVKQVKKIPNGKPGMVIYHTYKTVIANPYPDIVLDELNAEKTE